MVGNHDYQRIAVCFCKIKGDLYRGVKGQKVVGQTGRIIGMSRPVDLGPLHKKEESRFLGFWRGRKEIYGLGRHFREAGFGRCRGRAVDVVGHGIRGKGAPEPGGFCRQHLVAGVDKIVSHRFEYSNQIFPVFTLSAGLLLWQEVLFPATEHNIDVLINLLFAKLVIIIPVVPVGRKGRRCGMLDIGGCHQSGGAAREASPLQNGCKRDICKCRIGIGRIDGDMPGRNGYALVRAFVSGGIGGGSGSGVGDDAVRAIGSDGAGQYLIDGKRSALDPSGQWPGFGTGAVGQ